MVSYLLWFFLPLYSIKLFILLLLLLFGFLYLLVFLFVCVCVCAVYELLAIKYNYTLNPLDFFVSCFKPHSFYHHAHSRRGKEKSLIIKLIDFSAFFFFCALYLVTRDNFMGYFISRFWLYLVLSVQRRRLRSVNSVVQGRRTKTYF